MAEVAPIDLTLHPAQWQAFNSPARIIAFVAGIQSGKSLCGAAWMARQVAMYDGEDVNFILASPNYKILNQSAGPILRKFMIGAGKYRKMDDCYELNGGGHLWCRSMTDPNSCEGLSKVAGIWIDEAGLLSYLAWSNLLGRAAFLQCPIYISTTPYRLNWLYDMYQEWHKGERDDCEFIVCRSIDNPYFPDEEVARQKRILTPQLFAMKFEGTFSRPGGLVFQDFSPETHRIEQHIINRTEYQVYCGCDIGFNDPSALVVIAVHRNGRDIILVDEYYKAGLTVMDRIDVMKRFQTQYGVSTFIVDSAEAGEIEVMKRAKLPAIGVKKGAGSLFDGITKMQQVIREFKLKVMDGRCPNVRDEFNTYSYRENKEGALSDDIEDNHNHAMDAIRYVIMTVWASFLESVPQFTPQKTHLQKLIGGEYKKVTTNADDW